MARPVTAAKAVHPARKLAVRIHVHCRPCDLTIRTATRYHTAKPTATMGRSGTGGGSQPSIADTDGGDAGIAT